MVPWRWRSLLPYRTVTLCSPELPLLLVTHSIEPSCTPPTLWRQRDEERKRKKELERERERDRERESEQQIDRQNGRERERVSKRRQTDRQTENNKYHTLSEERTTP